MALAKSYHIDSVRANAITIAPCDSEGVDMKQDDDRIYLAFEAIPDLIEALNDIIGTDGGKA